MPAGLDMSGGHAHGPGHGHDHGHGTNQRRIGIAALLTGGFMFAEAIGGVMTGSLALIADAAHMLTDAVSLGFAWWAFRAANTPPTERRTFGTRRLPVLIAFANAVAIMMITVFILIEAVERFGDPVEVLAGPMLVVATGGLVVNIIAFLVLMGGERSNLNLRGALVHVVGDLLGSVAAMAAAIVILWTGWMPIDPLLSVFVALLILRAAIRLARESGHILLEGAPPGLEPGRIRAALAGSVPGLHDVRHVHVWALDERRPLVTLDAEPEPGADILAVTAGIKARLKAELGVDHSTIEIVPAPPVAGSDMPAGTAAC